MKKLMVILAVLTLALVMAACGGKPQAGSNSPGEQGKQSGAGQEKKVKVALLLPGPINDMGWNSSAYEGLKEAEKKFNIETKYTEKVSQSDMEDYMRGYAKDGFDLIIAHGFQFSDAAKKVAIEFPKAKFVVTQGDKPQEPNLAVIYPKSTEQGYLMGIVAGLMTKKNILGAVGGQEIPPIIDTIKGFETGVKEVNPQARVLKAFTGSFDDIGKAKQTALAMIDQGADIIMTTANQASLGGIEAAKEKGALAIGTNTDQNSVAPDTVIVSGMKSNAVGITYMVEQVIKNEFQPKLYWLGVKEVTESLKKGNINVDDLIKKNVQ
ncbi:MAG: BMP family protein [Firmicutes bacterium]|nr:BMP family protein [Bacillota bacterium]